MRVLGVVVVLAGAAFLAATAAADPVPVPPVPPLPAVTVPLPPAPVPAPSVPAPPVPAPSVPAAPNPAAPNPVATTTPAAPSGSPATSLVPSTASSAAGSSSGSPAPPTASPPSGTSSSSSSAQPAGRPSSKGWIGTTGPKRRRATTFAFVLHASGRVVVTVTEVSPACVGVGHFARTGRKGLNRVRFDGFVNGAQLRPGTYRISIRTAVGRVIRQLKFVVVDGAAPSAAELRALRSANTCGSSRATAATARSAATTANATPRPLPSAPTPKRGAAAGLAPPAPNLHSGVLATSIEKTARAIEPLLVALLVLSILLLGLASLPQEAVPGPRLHYILARHRVELAALGASALGAAGLAFLLT